MFSRALSVRSSLAARNLFRATPKTLAPLTSRFSRDFNSSSYLKQATGATPAATEVSDPPSIIQKYGASTFWGMLAAVAVSKEVFILDAEWLLSLEITAFATMAYVMTGNEVTKWSDGLNKTKQDKFNAANDFLLEMLDQYKMVQATAKNKPDVLAQYLAEYKKSLEEHAIYQTVAPKHTARSEMLTALEQIKNREEAAAAAEWGQAVDSTMGSVIDAFTNENNPEYAKLQAELMEMAINNIGSVKVVDVEQDPVKRMIMKGMENA